MQTPSLLAARLVSHLQRATCDLQVPFESRLTKIHLKNRFAVTNCRSLLTYSTAVACDTLVHVMVVVYSFLGRWLSWLALSPARCHIENEVMWDYPNMPERCFRL